MNRFPTAHGRFIIVPASQILARSTLNSLEKRRIESILQLSTPESLPLYFLFTAIHRTSLRRSALKVRAVGAFASPIVVSMHPVGRASRVAMARVLYGSSMNFVPWRERVGGEILQHGTA